MKKLPVVVILSFFFVFISQAENKPKPLPPSGTLATAGGGSKDGTYDGPWGDINLQNKEESPLIGSVSKISGMDYKCTVTNTSKDRYSATVSLEQLDQNGKLLKSNMAAVNLAGGETVVRDYRANANTATINLKLIRWKSSAAQRPVDEVKTDIKEKKQELKKLESELKPAK